MNLARLAVAALLLLLASLASAPVAGAALADVDAQAPSISTIRLGTTDVVAGEATRLVDHGADALTVSWLATDDVSVEAGAVAVGAQRYEAVLVDGRWSAQVPMVRGTNQLEIVAIDGDALNSRQALTVTLEAPVDYATHITNWYSRPWNAAIWTTWGDSSLPTNASAFTRAVFGGAAASIEYPGTTTGLVRVTSSPYTRCEVRRSVATSEPTTCKLIVDAPDNADFNTMGVVYAVNASASSQFVFESATNGVSGQGTNLENISIARVRGGQMELTLTVPPQDGNGSGVQSIEIRGLTRAFRDVDVPYLVQFTGPNDSTWGRAATVTASFNDFESRVAKIELLDAQGTVLDTVAQPTVFSKGTIGPKLEFERTFTATAGTAQSLFRSLRATDEFGNIARRDFMLRLDAVAPSLSSIKLDGTALTEANPSRDGVSDFMPLELAVSDADAGFDRFGDPVAVYVDDVRVGVSQSGAVWRGSIRRTNSSHQLRVVLTDKAGNASTHRYTFSSTKFVDEMKPLLESGTDDPAPANSCVTLSYTFRDADSKVLGAAIRERESGADTTVFADTGWTRGVPDAGLYVEREVCPGEASGDVIVDVTAWDHFNNTYERAVTLTFDLAAPAAAAPSVDGAPLADDDEFMTTATARVRLTVSDAETDVRDVDAEVAGASQPVTLERADGKVVAATIDVRVPAGRHTLTIEVRDSAGNESVITRRVVGVVPPRVDEPIVTAPIVGPPAPSSEPVGPIAAAAPAQPPTAAASGGGQVSATAVVVKRNAAPTLRVVAVASRPGQLQQSNMLTLRMRASEWSVWRVKVGGTTFLRRALVKSKWRTVRINLGDVTPIGRKLNAAKPGEFVRIPIAVQGHDAKSKRSSTIKLFVVVRA